MTALAIALAILTCVAVFLGVGSGIAWFYAAALGLAALTGIATYVAIEGLP